MIQLSIHVTHFSTASSAIKSLTTTSAVDAKGAITDVGSEKEPAHSDIEKTGDISPARYASPFRGLNIHPGRPNIANMIPSMIENTESIRETVIAVCGPKSLMLNTRQVVANLISVGRQSISLHCEQFGW